MNLGFSELLVILIIVLVIFGAGKLPRVMADLGKGVKSFKQGMNENEGTGSGPQGSVEHSSAASSSQIDYDKINTKS